MRIKYNYVGFRAELARKKNLGWVVEPNSWLLACEPSTNWATDLIHLVQSVQVIVSMVTITCLIITRTTVTTRPWDAKRLLINAQCIYLHRSLSPKLVQKSKLQFQYCNDWQKWQHLVPALFIVYFSKVPLMNTLYTSVGTTEVPWLEPSNTTFQKYRLSPSTPA
jgi:hypothetical protein